MSESSGMTKDEHIKEVLINGHIVRIDLSYVKTRTKEQAKIDEQMLTDAFWSLYDEQEEKKRKHP